ncbi:MAG: hypothetical protein ABWY00_09695 [Dongiaceae bacterium]
MAKSTADKTSEIEDAPDRPSELAESTHAELVMMYAECAQSIRFAKAQQWHSMGGVLLIFMALGIFSTYLPDSELALRSALVLSILSSIGGIYSLVIYQFWQGTERQKLSYVSDQLSSTLRQVRRLTSAREADFQRYVLLFFMVFCILAGNWLLVLYVMPKLHGPAS